MKVDGDEPGRNRWDAGPQRGRFDTYQFVRSPKHPSGAVTAMLTMRTAREGVQNVRIRRPEPPHATKGGRGCHHRQLPRYCPGPQAGHSPSTRSTTPGIPYPHGPTYRDGTGLAGPVDMADVTILVDNAIDILAADTAVAKRQPLAYGWSQQQHQLRSEHGYSLVLTVQRNGQSDTILYDAGLGRDTAINNMDLLGIKPSDFRTMVLSHGH